MNECFYKLANNRILGLSAFEVVSFPAADLLAEDPSQSRKILNQQFLSLLSNAHQLAPQDCCIEFLWLTEKADSQVFLSRVRIFCVLREIGEVGQPQSGVSSSLSMISHNIESALTGLHYVLSKTEKTYSELKSLLQNVDCTNVRSVVKREQLFSSTQGTPSFYLTDVVPHKNEDNLENLVSTLSNSKNSCFSVQLFPDHFSQEETSAISAENFRLSQLANGVVLSGGVRYQDPKATDALKVFSYFEAHRNMPLFRYNIFAFGDRAACSNLSANLVSVLRAGEEKIASSDFTTLDLSQLKINLAKQFPIYVYNMNNDIMYRNHQIYKNFPLFRLPYLMTFEEAVSLFRLPLYSSNTPALMCNQLFQVSEQFSSSVVAEDNIRFGRLVSGNSSDIVIGCPEKSFTKHMLIVGTPGSGKTTFSVSLLLQFADRNIPFLAIEPTKTEYRALIDVIPDLQVFTPGKNGVSPFIINPFVPPRGITLDQYIPSLTNAFKAAFSMQSPLDVIFPSVIRNCYARYGWKGNSKLGDPDVRLFGIHEFILDFKKLLESTTYSKEVRGNLESGGILRLSDLIEICRNVYDTVNTVPIEDLLTKPTVLELNAIDNSEQKSLIMALLLINVCLYTKHNQLGDGKLKNVMLIDEAHVLLAPEDTSSQNGGPAASATTVRALQDMIAEIRSYGTSIIIADQSPTKVTHEVIDNTDIKVAFKLVGSVQRNWIADSTNMDDASRKKLAQLDPGEAFVYNGLLKSPQLIMTEDIREKEGIRLAVPDMEVAERNIYWKERAWLLRPYRECDFCRYCSESCDFDIRDSADYLALSAYNDYKDKITNDTEAGKIVYNLPALMADELSKIKIADDASRQRLITCAKIKLLRKLERVCDFPISDVIKKKCLSAGNDDTGGRT